MRVSAGVTKKLRSYGDRDVRDIEQRGEDSGKLTECCPFPLSAENSEVWVETRRCWKSSLFWRWKVDGVGS